MQSYWKSKGLGVLLLMCILWLPDRATGATETVFLPVTLEYPFIRSVLVHQLYNSPGERAIVIDETREDCVHIELSNPEVSRELSMIKVGSKIKIRAGVPIPGTCMGLFEWEGYIEVLQRPVLDEKSWQARFETIDSRESCWRQFIVQDGKIRYLLSYNQTSVGLMQINERVWRGIYRVESLRWNITYNVKAGMEILHLYLRNFTLKEIKPANPADLDTIARVTYAIYNGGPGELKRYFKRSNANRFYKSDRLFREKYTAAKEAKFDQLALCLSGE